MIDQAFKYLFASKLFRVKLYGKSVTLFLKFHYSCLNTIFHKPDMPSTSDSSGSKLFVTFSTIISIYLKRSKLFFWEAIKTLKYPKIHMNQMGKLKITCLHISHLAPVHLSSNKCIPKMEREWSDSKWCGFKDFSLCNFGMGTYIWSKIKILT